MLDIVKETGSPDNTILVPVVVVSSSPQLSLNSLNKEELT